MTLAVLIPAHNEEASIGATVASVLAQTRQPDLFIVIPNGCADRTADVARDALDGAGLVIELPSLAHRKAEALNIAWSRYAQDADVVVCLDADTVLPANALADWERELRDPRIGGSSSKFTMLGEDLLTRLQRAEFARWTDSSLRRGWTSVLAGTGCAISGAALREVAARSDRVGPWCYTSATEDFELTYRIRQLGYRCQVSPSVRAYTDAMRTFRALWGQRMKWQVGTVEDLLTFGVNRMTRLDWWQQAAGLAAALVRGGFVLTMALGAVLGVLDFQPLWLLPTLVFVANDVKQSLRIPHRDAWDVLLAALLVPQEIFAWLRAGWFVAGWVSAIRTRITGITVDRWSAQYLAERG